MEKFDWPRMYRVEEYIEREAYNAVEEFVVDFYNVEEIGLIPKQQIDEMMAWREEHVNEYSAMWGAFTDVYNVWEMENEL